ncbi:MAG: dCTP deaminase [Patescibacteria group bacterium]
MFLSDLDIKKALDSGDITIENFDETRLQVASYDVLLGNKFVVTDTYSTQVVDPARKIFPKTHELIIPDDGEFVLHPGVSVLGEVADFVGSKKDFLIQISGKSSLARIGLIVHNTAGIINPGHYLNIVLELCNLSAVPIILRPRMEIAQLLFSKLTSSPSKSYEEVGRYHENNWDSFKTKE